MSYDSLQPPVNLPEPGFYYHYKHDPGMRNVEYPNAGVRNYAYKVLPSFGLYTEDDGPADKFRVKYLPLYPWAKVYEISQIVGRICEDDRPVSMFLEPVKNDTYDGPRFVRITEPDIIAKLEKYYDEMWNDFPV